MAKAHIGNNIFSMIYNKIEVCGFFFAKKAFRFVHTSIISYLKFGAK